MTGKGLEPSLPTCQSISPIFFIVTRRLEKYFQTESLIAVELANSEAKVLESCLTQKGKENHTDVIYRHILAKCYSGSEL